MAAWLIVLVILLPWLGALSVWFMGDGRPRAQHITAVFFSVASALASVALLPFTSSAPALHVAAGGVFGDFTFTPDGLGVFLALIATIIGSLTVVFSIDYMRGKAQLGRYYALVLLFIGAMAGLVLTSSLLLLFLFWEVVAFCSYALISFDSDNPKAVVGGIKALVITQIGGVGLLAGVLVAFASLGSYDFDVLLDRAGTLSPAALSVTAFGFLLAAAAKSAQVPLHMWLPDAMEAPTPVSALIHAATMVNAGVYLLARFYPAFAAVPSWTESVIIIGVLSALLAALMALTADDLKRVLAYSTISQLGFMFFAVGVGGIFAGQFHLLSHAVFKALLFLGAGAIIHILGTRDLRQMGGLARQMPFVCTVFIIGALALMGIPVLNGFWSKELILEAGLSAAPGWAVTLMFVTVGLTAAYTTRVSWLVFFAPAQSSRSAIHDAPPAMRVALALLALGALTTWLAAGPLGALLGDQTSSTVQTAEDVIASPLMPVALLTVALGVAAWWWRARWMLARLPVIDSLVRHEFGSEWVVQVVADAVRRMAVACSRLQSGQLNWNVAGIVGGLLAVILLLVSGIGR
jgi:NADH-quinone oxidoreductase subunit L